MHIIRGAGHFIRFHPNAMLHSLGHLDLINCEVNQLGNPDQARMIYDHIKKYRTRLNKLHSSWIMELREIDRYLEEARLLLGVEEEKPEEDTEAQTTDK